MTPRPLLDGRYHHLHLRSAVPDDAARWYAELFGGRTGAAGDYRLASFDDHFLIWTPDEAPPSHGSSVDHFGWSTDELETVLGRCLDAGATLVSETKVVGPAEDESIRFPIAFFDDPWGTRVELLDDGDLRGLHHLHFLVEDPEEHRSWFQQVLGGAASPFKKLLPGLRLERLWLLWRPSESELEPTRSRALDHFAWRVGDLDAALSELEQIGLRPEDPPHEVGGLRVAFVEAPAGVRLELVEPA